MIIQMMDELIGEWTPIATEGAWFNGVDVHWCFGAIIVAVIITALTKLFMCFFN